MEIAALVLGIVSLLMSFIPLIGLVAIVPAIVGLVLGIIALVNANKEKKPKGMSIAGVILSGLALLVMLWWVMMVGIFANSTYFRDATTKVEKRLEDRYYDYDYNYDI